MPHHHRSAHFAQLGRGLEVDFLHALYVQLENHRQKNRFLQINACFAAQANIITVAVYHAYYVRKDTLPILQGQVSVACASWAPTVTKLG